MRLATYSPDDPIFHFFYGHSEHEFIENGDDKCQAIFVGSVTQWQRVPRGAGLPLITHVWDLPTNWRRWCRDLDDYQSNVYRDSQIAQQLHLLWESDLVIACSYHTRDVLNTMGIKSEVLHNFYDGAGIDKILEGYEIKKKNRIIQVSRFALNKRFELTMQMWNKIQDRHTDWELVLVGPGVADGLKGYVGKNVTKHNELNRSLLIKMMADSKILVQPSINEGMGLTPLEARHMGLDTVCSDMPWTNEFLYATKVFEPDNLDEYAQKVEDAIASPAGFAEKNTDMTPEKYAKRFDKLIGKTIG